MWNLALDGDTAVLHIVPILISHSLLSLTSPTQAALCYHRFVLPTEEAIKETVALLLCSLSGGRASTRQFMYHDQKLGRVRKWFSSKIFGIIHVKAALSISKGTRSCTSSLCTTHSPGTHRWPASHQPSPSCSFLPPLSNLPWRRLCCVLPGSNKRSSLVTPLSEGWRPALGLESFSKSIDRTFSINVFA